MAQPYLQPGEQPTVVAFAHDDADVPWWKVALWIAFVVVLLPLAVLGVELPWTAKHAGWVVIVSNRGAFLVPAKLSDGLFTRGFHARRGAIRAWALSELGTLRPAVEAKRAEGELRVAWQEAGGAPTKLLFREEALLPSNLASGMRFAELVASTAHGTPAAVTS